ncbi:MAG: ATP-binding cassette domain-containing protein, partial [Alphaproteobacteria bacterium]|nr:ATP-binding cassette domain-containing protein [Alphaproteobacteria bacterium]
ANALARLRAFLTSPAMMPLFDAPFVPLFLLILIALHPMIGLIAAAAAVILLLTALVHTLTTARLQRETAQSGERADRWWSTVAGNGQIAGALGLGPGATSQWELFNRAQIAGSYSHGKRSGFVKVVSRTVRLGAQVGVYGVGAWLVVGGELTPGALVASAILISRVIGPLEQLVGSIKAIRTAWVAYIRLKAIAADATVPALGEREAAPKGAVVLSQVSFQYPGRRVPALRGVSLNLNPAECLAVVGPNGAGKSTLAAVIAGAVNPSNGAAVLDGIPIAKWQRWEGLPPVGYAPDDPILIEGSVHANIARFREASLTSVTNAAMAAGVHDVLQALPEGYDTPVGPHGRALSLSERRAVSLARALHGKPCIVVLDEPEAGLDGAGIRAMIETLGALKKSGTGLVIATQDPRMLEVADHMALLGQGTLVSHEPAGSLLQSYEQTRARSRRPQPPPAPQQKPPTLPQQKANQPGQPPQPEPAELH